LLAQPNASHSTPTAYRRAAVAFTRGRSPVRVRRAMMR
jgi:hypothetical protein